MWQWLRSKLPFLGKADPLVVVVPLNGAIGAAGRFSRGLQLSTVEDLLEQAFRTTGATAVALAINSPGGSPVQAALIHDRIRALSVEKSIPVFAFTEDVAASGGYMLALAGDEIFAHPSSILGSIGVISAGFGFVELIEKIGVERRVHTAGTRKAMLDPFQPERPEDLERLRKIQADIHAIFADMVRTRRKGKLKAPEEQLFSGDVWLGGEALNLGLVDGLGDLRGIMRQRFGDKVKFRHLGRERGRLRELLGIGTRRGAVEDLLDSMEHRALWARFGL